MEEAIVSTAKKQEQPDSSPHLLGYAAVAICGMIVGFFIGLLF